MMGQSTAMVPIMQLYIVLQGGLTFSIANRRTPVRTNNSRNLLNADMLRVADIMAPSYSIWAPSSFQLSTERSVSSG
jgi:hypothetical protein